MFRTAALAVLFCLGAAASGCLGAPETGQLRALNDDLQRRNAELAAEKLGLEAEVGRLRAENAALRRGRTNAGETTP